MTTSEVIERLIRRENFQTIAKFNFLNDDETLLYGGSFTADVLTGSTLSTKRQKQGVRRSCNIKFANNDGKYTPSPTGIIWRGRKFKLKIGYKFEDGEEVLYPSGVFIIKKPKVTDKANNQTVTISAIDKYGILDGQIKGGLKYLYGIPIIEDGVLKRPNLYDVIPQILLDAGEVNPPIIDAIEEPLLAYSIYEEVGGKYSNILKDISNSIAHNIYYDVNGIFRSEQDIPDSSKSSSFELRDENIIYQGSTNSYEINQPNHIIVIGNNINGDTDVRGEALIDDPTSPFTTVYGDVVTKKISDNLISTVEQANGRAEYELKDYQRMQNSISISTIPLFFAQEDTIFSITNERYGYDNERFLITGITHTLDSKGNYSKITGSPPSDIVR